MWRHLFLFTQHTNDNFDECIWATFTEQPTKNWQPKNRTTEKKNCRQKSEVTGEKMCRACTIIKRQLQIWIVTAEGVRTPKSMNILGVVFVLVLPWSNFMATSHTSHIYRKRTQSNRNKQCDNVIVFMRAANVLEAIKVSLCAPSVNDKRARFYIPYVPLKCSLSNTNDHFFWQKNSVHPCLFNFCWFFSRLEFCTSLNSSHAKQTKLSRNPFSMRSIIIFTSSNKSTHQAGSIAFLVGRKIDLF